MSDLLIPRGAVLFEEHFEHGLADWHHEGGGRVEIAEPGVMRLDCTGSRQGGVGTQAFCRRDFPDHIAIEYDMRVEQSNGLVITFFAMRGLHGDDGVHTGVSNFRRNPGCHLRGQGLDLCKEIRRTYRVCIVKDGLHCQLGVDGRLAHEFTDPEELPDEVPTAGKTGFRAIGSLVVADLSNFRVTALR